MLKTLVAVKWLHDPNGPGGTSLGDGRHKGHVHNWTVVNRPNTGEFERCGALMGTIADATGSCGAPAGHEFPHVWMWHGYELESICRVGPTRRESLESLGTLMEGSRYE